MQATKLQQSYQKKVNELRKEIQRLDKLATEIKTRKDAATKARQAIHDRRQEVAYLESQREELKGEYADASFDQDQDAIADVVERRNAIDARIKDIAGEVAAQQKTVESNAVDIHSSTELAVELDTLKLPEVFTYVKELERILQSEKDELASAIKTARGMLPSDPELYDDARAEVDSNWKSTARRMKERQARADKEKMLWQNATKNGTITL